MVLRCKNKKSYFVKILVTNIKGFFNSRNVNNGADLSRPSVVTTCKTYEIRIDSSF